MLDTKTNSSVVSGVEGRQAGAEMDAALVTALTSGQYGDGLLAAIRETATNAADSHVKVGKGDVPFDITLELDSGEFDSARIVEQAQVTEENPQVLITVRDYGEGLDADFLQNKYFRLAVSRSRGDAKVAGGFGLGSKAMFAISDVCCVTSYDGKKSRMVFGVRCPKRGIIVTDIHEEDSDEPTGLKVSFSTTVENAPELAVRFKAGVGRRTSQKQTRGERSFMLALARAVLPFGHEGSNYRVSPKVVAFGNDLKLHPLRLHEDFKRLKRKQVELMAHPEFDHGWPFLVTDSGHKTDLAATWSGVLRYSDPPNSRTRAPRMRPSVLWHNVLYEVPGSVWDAALATPSQTDSQTVLDSYAADSKTYARARTTSHFPPKQSVGPLDSDTVKQLLLHEQARENVRDAKDDEDSRVLPNTFGDLELKVLLVLDDISRVSNSLICLGETDRPDITTERTRLSQTRANSELMIRELRKAWDSYADRLASIRIPDGEHYADQKDPFLKSFTDLQRPIVVDYRSHVAILQGRPTLAYSTHSRYMERLFQEIGGAYRDRERSKSEETLYCVLDSWGHWERPHYRRARIRHTSSLSDSNTVYIVDSKSIGKCLNVIPGAAANFFTYELLTQQSDDAETTPRKEFLAERKVQAAKWVEELSEKFTMLGFAVITEADLRESNPEAFAASKSKSRPKMSVMKTSTRSWTDFEPDSVRADWGPVVAFIPTTPAAAESDGKYVTLSALKQGLKVNANWPNQIPAERVLLTSTKTATKYARDNGFVSMSELFERCLADGGKAVRRRCIWKQRDGMTELASDAHAALFSLAKTLGYRSASHLLGVTEKMFQQTRLVRYMSLNDRHSRLLNDPHHEVRVQQEYFRAKLEKLVNARGALEDVVRKFTTPEQRSEFTRYAERYPSSLRTHRYEFLLENFFEEVTGDRPYHGSNNRKKQNAYFAHITQTAKDLEHALNSPSEKTVSAAYLRWMSLRDFILYRQRENEPAVEDFLSRRGPRKRRGARSSKD